MVSKFNQYKKLSEANKTISDGIKKLAKASEQGIEYEYTPKMGKTGFKK